MNTLGVTGSRPKSLGLGEFVPQDETWTYAAAQVKAILDHNEVDALISGGALGFDMIAAKVAVDAGVALVLAKPFRDYDAQWSDKDRKRLAWLDERSAKSLFVCEPGYAPWKYQERNQYIVDNSDRMLGFWNGLPGGTKNCLDYAVKQKVPYRVIWAGAR